MDRRTAGGERDDGRLMTTGASAPDREMIMQTGDFKRLVFNMPNMTRVVIKTEGVEVDVANIQQFAQLVVITPAVELTDAVQAESDLYSAQQRIEELELEVLRLTRELDEAQSDE